MGLLPAQSSQVWSLQRNLSRTSPLGSASGRTALPAGHLSLMLSGKSFFHMEGFNQRRDILYGFLGGCFTRSATEQHRPLAITMEKDSVSGHRSYQRDPGGHLFSVVLHGILPSCLGSVDWVVPGG